MQKVNRRTPGMTGIVQQQQQGSNTKKFNEAIRYVQGYRYAQIAPGNNPQTPSLASPGRMLLGIAILPISGADISDIAIDFAVNNFNLLTGTCASNMNPNFVQGMIYYPLPQPLQTNDSLKVNFNKSNAGTIGLYLNIYYIPR